MGDEDKQFEASQQKLERVRKEGQVVKSKDFSMAIGMIIMFFVIFKISPFIWDRMTNLFVLLYEQIPNKHLEDMGYAYILFVTVVPVSLILLPILFLAGFVGIMGDLIQIGPLFTVTPLSPKLDKLNPTKYFKNLFSIKTLFELFKNIVKVVLLGVIGYDVYLHHLPAILTLIANENKFAIMQEFGNLIFEFVMKAGLAFLIISVADYGVTRWKFMQDQKMSFKEVKDEYKNSEGDPLIKQALRQRRQQMLQQSMMDAVPECDFVVTNPTHVACALKYDQATMESPRLMAKGTELFAKKIIQIAREHNVPVIENPVVARALFRMVEINREIPPDLYKAVAEILLFVYNLRNSNNSGKIK